MLNILHLAGSPGLRDTRRPALSAVFRPRRSPPCLSRLTPRPVLRCRASPPRGGADERRAGIRALAVAVETRDPATRRHSREGRLLLWACGRPLTEAPSGKRPSSVPDLGTPGAAAAA